MKRLLTILFATMLAEQIMAVDYDFSAKCSSGQTLYYRITSNTEPYTVEVSYPNYSEEDFYYNCIKPIGDLIIPETVTQNGITYSVKSISYAAFKDCDGLKSTVIPNSITSIGGASFAGCSALESITIPFVGAERCTPDIDTSTYNGFAPYYLGHLFGTQYYSGSISTQFYEDFRDGQTFSIPSALTSVTITDSYYIPKSAFSNCSNLTSIVIQEPATEIADYAFYGCSNLTTISIPNSITNIGNAAFKNCNKLDYATYDNGYYIGNKENPYVVLMSVKNKSITSCTINDQCKIIYEAFCGCTNLSEITIPNSVKKIGYQAFKSCGVESITIPNSVMSIGDYAFSSCGLKSIIIPESVISIGNYAFSSCYYLNLSIPNSVTTIGSHAFSYCDMESVVIPNTVTEVGAYAFEYCGELTSVTIGNGLKNIDNTMFRYCQKLTRIICLIDVPVDLDADPFEYCDTIYVPNKNVEAYKSAPIWKRKEILPFCKITLKSANNSMGAVEGDSILYGNNPTIITAVPASGYHFVKWSDENTTNPRPFTSNENKSIIAYFDAHTEVKDEAVAATTTSTGLTEGSHCSVCGEVIVAQEVIPMLADNGEENNNGETNNEGENNNSNQNNNQGNGNNNNGGNQNTPKPKPTTPEGIIVQNILDIIHNIISFVTDVDEDAVNEVNIYAYGNNVVVENAETNKGKIEVFDINGRMVAKSTANNSRIEIPMKAQGVYIVRVGAIAKRVVVN